MALAALGRVQAIAKRDGLLNVPDDVAEFSDIADVIFLDDQSQPVEFDGAELVFTKGGKPVKFVRAVVAWEK